MCVGFLYFGCKYRIGVAHAIDIQHRELVRQRHVRKREESGKREREREMEEKKKRNIEIGYKIKVSQD